MSPKSRNLVQVNLAVLIWGGTAMFAKGIALPVGNIICIRSLIAAGALFLFLLAMRTPLKVKNAGHYGAMVVLGLLLCGHWLTYFKALKVSTAAVTLLALSTYPVFTALIEPFLFREKLKKVDIAVALAVFGGILIMTPKISWSNSTTQGIVIGFVSGQFFMVRNLMIRKYVQEYSGSTLMFWQTLVVGVVLTPVLFLTSNAQYTPTSWGLLVLLATLFTALPQSLFAAGFKNLSAKTVGILATLLPFYGALLGYLIHDEKVTARTAIGGLIVLTGIIFETAKNVRTPPAND
jgi:drug/metabolite transporter (DMT)-like permease